MPPKKQKKITIILPPSPQGPGMIKSPALDIASLIALLNEKKKYDVNLMDLRIRVIDHDNTFKNNWININIFNRYEECFAHLLKKADLTFTWISRKILKILDIKDADVAIFSVAVLEQFSLQYLLVSLCIAKELRKKHPDIKILFFGNCPKIHARKIMRKFDFIDAFLEDGSEFSIVRYLEKDNSPGKTPGMVVRKDGKLHYVDTPIKFNINALPTPDFALFDIKKYKNNGKLVLPYEISRGCKNNCFFCYYIHKGGLAVKRIDKVLSELRSLSDKYQTNIFHMMDAAINFDNVYLENLCMAFKKYLPKIKWSALAIPDMSRGLLAKMHEAGCVQLRWGIEYGSNRMLKIINKKTTVEGIKETLRNSHETGIYNYITLLSGIKIEKKSDIAQTIEFIKEISPYVDSAKECAWGELGYFSIAQFERLIQNENRRLKPFPISSRYALVLKECSIPSEDIIQVLTKNP